MGRRGGGCLPSKHTPSRTLAAPAPGHTVGCCQPDDRTLVLGAPFGPASSRCRSGAPPKYREARDSLMAPVARGTPRGLLLCQDTGQRGDNGALGGSRGPPYPLWEGWDAPSPRQNLGQGPGGRWVGPSWPRGGSRTPVGPVRDGFRCQRSEAALLGRGIAPGFCAPRGRPEHACPSELPPEGCQWG